MKQIYLYLGVLLIALVALGAKDFPGFYRQRNVSHLVGGEHSPLIYSGTASINAGDTDLDTTEWMQIGYSPYAGKNDNVFAMELNPEVFTMLLKLSGADSVAMSKAWFQTAMDTTTRARLTMTASDAVFVVGETITGGTSGATGTFVSCAFVGADSVVILTDVYGLFTTEEITGSTSEETDDASAVAHWGDNWTVNADSSNVFIQDGNYSHDFYGSYMFEDFTDTTYTYSFPLRVQTGGFIRFFYECDNEDVTGVIWELICEN